MILSRAQITNMTKAQGAGNEVLPVLEFLEAVAQVYPPIQERVKQYRDMREMLMRVTETALETERAMSTHG